MDKVIEIVNLTFTYPDGTKALQNLSLEVAAGESIGIIGPNGAGKSTLLLHLNGILKGDGLIKVCGLEINAANLASIRKKVGLVFQDADSQLFMPSVFDDVAFGPLNLDWPKEKIIREVDSALVQTDTMHLKDRLSHHLSYGEKKRTCLATVLAMKPEILVFDEPSSNLDPRHRRDLINFLKKINHTKVIATHDLDFVLQLCSRVALLDNGRLVLEGETIAMLKNNALLESHGLEAAHGI